MATYGVSVSSAGISIGANGYINVGTSGASCCCECATGKKCVQKWTLGYDCNGVDPITGRNTGAGTDPVAGAKTCVDNHFAMGFQQVSRTIDTCTFEGYLPLGGCCTNSATCVSLPDTATPSKVNSCSEANRDCSACNQSNLTVTISGAEAVTDSRYIGPPYEANGTFDLVQDTVAGIGVCTYVGDVRNGTETLHQVHMLLYSSSGCPFWYCNVFCSGCGGDATNPAFGCYSTFVNLDVSGCVPTAGWITEGHGTNTYRNCSANGTMTLS